VNRPALIMAHNKTLAAQLYHEFKQFFPHNAVEYFVLLRLLPAGGLYSCRRSYIEKEATINDELDKLRLSATRSLFERRDCDHCFSVSCIYGLGSPEAYYGMLLLLEKGQKIKREDITRGWSRFFMSATIGLPARDVSGARRCDRGLPYL
jgi:excinuclease ABC subunit B